MDNTNLVFCHCCGQMTDPAHVEVYDGFNICERPCCTQGGTYDDFPRPCDDIDADGYTDDDGMPGANDFEAK